MTQTKWVTKYTTKKVWVYNNWWIQLFPLSGYTMSYAVNTADSTTMLTFQRTVSPIGTEPDLPYLYDSVAVTPNVRQTLDINIPYSDGEFTFQISEYQNGHEVVLASQGIIPSIDAHQQVALTFIPTVQHATLKVIPKQKISGGKREVYIGKWKTIQEPYLEQEQVLVTLCDSVDDKYRFGFNGMEKDNELKGLGNSLDFEFRMYDSRIGRFMSVDPLAQSYPYYTPYQFGGNRVISCIDIEGLEDIYFMDKKIEEIQGEPIVEILNGVEIFQEELSKFRLPAYNKGYNIIILDVMPVIKDETMESKASRAFINGLTIGAFDKIEVDFYARGILTGNEHIFTKEVLESNAFKETVEAKRGVIFVYLPNNTIEKSKKWANELDDKEKGELNEYNLFLATETVSHECIAHAFKKARTGNQVFNKNSVIEDHDEYFSQEDKKWDSKSSSSSPSPKFIQDRYPESSAGKSQRQINKQINKIRKELKKM